MELIVNQQSIFYANGDVAWQSGQPALCLIHGAAMDHTVWTLFSRYFARRGYNVFAPDLSGHARSAGELYPTIPAMGEWLLAAIDAAGLEQVAVAGHSMGSLVALEAASQAPERIEKLLLLGTAVPMPVGEPLLTAAQNNEQASRDMVSIFGHAYASRLGGNPVAGISVLNTALALMELAGDDVMYTDLKACNEYTNGLEAAAAVTAQTSLILGKLDRMTPPAAARSLIENLTSATVYRLPDSGHMMMAEQPEETLQAMKSALGVA